MFTLLDIRINRGHTAHLFQILPALLKLFAYSTPLKFESEFFYCIIFTFFSQSVPLFQFLSLVMVPSAVQIIQAPTIPHPGPVSGSSKQWQADV